MQRSREDTLRATGLSHAWTEVAYAYMDLLGSKSLKTTKATIFSSNTIRFVPSEHWAIAKVNRQRLHFRKMKYCLVFRVKRIEPGRQNHEAKLYI